jgi:hypothetical protein
MAKRVPEGEKPYRPVDASLVRSVISPSPQEGDTRQAEPVTEEGAQRGPVTEKFDREKRLLLTCSEERAVERLVSCLAGEVGTPVKLSHVLRACTSLLLKYESRVLEEAGRSPKITRPPNGDMKGLSEFEQSIARILEAAFQDQ